MERRRFLLTLAAGLAGAAAVHGAAGLGDIEPARATAVRAARHAAPRAAAPVRHGVPGLVAVDPPTGVVSRLPGDGRSLALTIDDGTSSEVVAAFLTLAVHTGIRLTFFPNGRYRSWRENAAVLRPLVDSGQVALGNHTWSHPDVTKLPDHAVADEIRRNRDFLWTVFGVRDTPFFRPPYGAHDARTDRIAADLGHPTIALWDGTLGDSTVLTGPQVVAGARRWFTAQRIVIGHANHPAVTTVYGELLDLIAQRGLRTVTLADVWASPAARLRGAEATGRGSAH
ncbi:MAG TPA: polysaccharide deacetylase family protein [Blastococcus sp.]|jgi:peptidoglycan/xylan/chitin deacetylase (PgdA/CDA1 family)|nr:polysaccharide deacetylase family protein [Blastococcus sp.]